jgi:hypothetical protein
VIAVRGGTVVLVVLVTRTIAYALVPGPRAAALADRAGGPALPTVAIGALTGALALAAAIVFLASLAVREQVRLEPRAVVAVPALRVRRVMLRALALFAVSAPASTALEAYVHWRAGLGWHGLACLSGPVHRDLLPLAAAVSLVAAAAAAAVGHVLAWMRRVVTVLGSAPRLAPRRPALWAAPVQAAPRPATQRLRSARAPPLLSF